MSKHSPSANSVASPSYWTRLSDDELQKVSFTTDDPENLTGLVEHVPATEERPFVELAYDFRGNRRPYIRCAHCKYPNHLAGFVLKTQNGERFLCGHNCGAKIYGADFDRLHGEFQYARDRASYLRRLGNMRLALPAFLAYLDALQKDPAFGLYSAVRTGLITNMPRLKGALEVALERDGGNLSVQQNIRDLDAESRDQERYEREMDEWNAQTLTERKKQRKSGYTPAPPERPVYKVVYKVIATVPAMTMFSVQANPLRIISEIATQFANLNTTPSSNMSEAKKLNLFAYRGKRDARGSMVRVAYSLGEDISNRAIAEMLKQIGILLERIEEQINRLNEPVVFFQPTLLSSVTKWANNHALGGEYRSGDRWLSFEDGWGHVKKVSLPETYRPPMKAGVDLFRSAINKVA